MIFNGPLVFASRPLMVQNGSFHFITMIDLILIRSLGNNCQLHCCKMTPSCASLITPATTRFGRADCINCPCLSSMNILVIVLHITYYRLLWMPRTLSSTAYFFYCCIVKDPHKLMPFSIVIVTQIRVVVLVVIITLLPIYCSA